MTNCPMDSIDQYDDISTKDQYEEALKAGLSEEEALKICQRFSRDNARTPMQWSEEEEAGFTTGKPWLFINPNYKEINVKAEEEDADSILNYYKKLIALRKSKEYIHTFTYGTFLPVYEEKGGIGPMIEWMRKIKFVYLLTYPIM